MKPETKDPGPKTWMVCYYVPVMGHAIPHAYGAPDLMTAVEAAHLESVLNERDHGRGIRWVAVESK